MKRRCVGAFRRPCLILTDRILCDACWDVVGREEDKARPWLTPKGWKLAERAA